MQILLLHAHNMKRGINVAPKVGLEPRLDGDTCCRWTRAVIEYYWKLMELGADELDVGCLGSAD